MKTSITDYNVILSLVSLSGTRFDEDENTFHPGMDFWKKKQTKRMRHLLLAAALLYSVIAEFEGEKSHRTSNVETQSWLKKFLPWRNIDHNFLPSTIVMNRSGIDPTDLPVIQMKNLQDLRKVTRYRSSIMEEQPIFIIMYEYQELIDDRLESGRIRRENHGWTVQEPFYVKEPSWIAIDENGKVLGKVSEDNDPFFVTRGKKILNIKEKQNTKGTRYYNNVRNQKYSRGTNNEDTKKNVETGSGYWNPEMYFIARELNENQKYPEFLKNVLKDLEKSLYKKNWKNLKDDLMPKNLNERSSISSKISLTKTDTKEEYPRGPAEHLQHEGVMNMLEKERRKRDVNSKKTFRNDQKDFYDEKNNFEKRTNYKLKNEDLREIIKNAILEQGYRVNFKDLSLLQPRNKHSNNLDIFDEPFFISRGKKKIQNYPEPRQNIQDLSEDAVSGEASEEFAQSISACEYLLKIFGNSKFCQDPPDKRSEEKTPRNRRGMLDEILTSYDPFYVARGKRTSSQVSGNPWERGIFEKL
ncbi:uncharacterized protein LOC107266342 isoform X2 [Cephus cinctus]|uniref:Uncharacterized protein LOC107266342 isoform X2 n=1 Tax=Cephus cinctus TaxID=211228 RepID=A0AAJ7BQX5_CEPCN|nr:uncharacterized protein LOC107266342 isoform X2 [Cephus cinctus]